ncbi:MAG: fatty acid desaturase family protein [Gemmatimonadetes bacterium]|nr:fatty acid desaturase family protein [Gemmatimonadota bacterium]
MLVAAQVLAVWLITDFLSGVFHWIEDAYGGPYWPIFGRHVTRPNILHHYAPRAFVSNSWWRSSRLLLVICLLLALGAWTLGVFNWMIALGLVLGLNANQVHKWSHRARRENPPLVQWLQRLHLIQSPSQHHRHHVRGRNAAYCVLTDLLNPVLDRMRFWAGLEWLIARLFGVQRRDDTAAALLVLEREPEFFGAYLPVVRQRVAAEVAARRQGQAAA